jgi:TatD DNase family protein
MPLIDSHAHLTYPDFAGQIDEVLERCALAGVDRVISIGTSLADAEKVIALARKYPGRIHAAAGFHPHHTDAISGEDAAAMNRLWADENIVALGEMGLDYHYDFAKREDQRNVFSGQLSAALAIDKPVIIHSREAFKDTAAMLVDHGFRGRRVVFHCFTGTAEEAAAIAGHGWRISFTGIVTFPKSDALQAIARDYPADKLMVETDSPYLSPVPVRGKKPNEPAFVAHTARFLAQLREVSYEQLCEATSQNTTTFFGLSTS